MSVLDRSALEDSPLADLHALASELGIDGFRRLRKADLIDKIIAQQGGEEGTTDEGADDEAEEKPKRTRARRSRAKKDADADADEDDKADKDDKPARKPRAAKDKDKDDGADKVVEGTVELLGNGSGFLRVSPPDPSDDDVYISAAQVRRCELVSGDTVAGPVRAPRRSERYPSLVRVDTINGRAADEVAEGTHFDDLPAAFPSERIALGSEDATLKAIEWLTPIGRGSRAVISGGPRAGKSEALRRLADALAAQDGLELTVVLTGARPEEVAEWRQGPAEPAAALTFAASHDAQSQAAERAVETAKRIAARGGDAVVLIDGLDGLHPHTARKIMGAARDIVDGGSLTIVATSSEPIGGETTVIALDPALTSTRRFPALDLVASGTLRPELLVGEAGADAIAQARKKALDDGAA
jgi:transcription termination factor Rho